jgi:hypothetical protein
MMQNFNSRSNEESGILKEKCNLQFAFESCDRCIKSLIEKLEADGEHLKKNAKEALGKKLGLGDSEKELNSYRDELLEILRIKMQKDLLTANKLKHYKKFLSFLEYNICPPRKTLIIGKLLDKSELTSKIKYLEFLDCLSSFDLKSNDLNFFPPAKFSISQCKIIGPINYSKLLLKHEESNSNVNFEMIIVDRFDETMKMRNFALRRGIKFNNEYFYMPDLNRLLFIFLDETNSKQLLKIYDLNFFLLKTLSIEESSKIVATDKYIVIIFQQDPLMVFWYDKDLSLLYKEKISINRNAKLVDVSSQYLAFKKSKAVFLIKTTFEELHDSNRLRDSILENNPIKIVAESALYDAKFSQIDSNLFFAYTQKDLLVFNINQKSIVFSCELRKILPGYDLKQDSLNFHYIRQKEEHLAFFEKNKNPNIITYI